MKQTHFHKGTERYMQTLTAAVHGSWNHRNQGEVCSSVANLSLVSAIALGSDVRAIDLFNDNMQISTLVNPDHLNDRDETL
jgi:hypothetical protein